MKGIDVTLKSYGENTTVLKIFGSMWKHLFFKNDLDNPPFEEQVLLFFKRFGGQPYSEIMKMPRKLRLILFKEELAILEKEKQNNTK